MFATPLMAMTLAASFTCTSAACALPRSHGIAVDHGASSSTGVTECVLRVARAYAERDLEGYAGSFTIDYRFTFGDPELRAAYPAGFTRDDEVASAAHLFHGFVDGRGHAAPAARSIRVQLDSLYETPDPGHPDSTDEYRCVVVSRTAVEVVLETGECLRSGPDPHRFHCVRGDVALLDRGQPASPALWYIRAWDELPASVTPVAKPAPVADVRPAAVTSPVALAIRPLANPMRGTGAVQLTVPVAGTVALDVLDVTGRRVERRSVGVLEPGIHRLPFAIGHLAPGVYWLRIVNGRTAAAARVIVVR